MKYNNLVMELKEEIVVSVRNGKGTVKKLKQYIRVVKLNEKTKKENNLKNYNF
jgi:hypothetical protein